MRLNFFTASLVAIAGLCTAAGAHAQGGDRINNPYKGWGEGGNDEGEFAFVVMVTSKEIVFDAGTRAGVKTGDRVRIYRTLTVRHPVTGEEISDKFPIGTVRVARASELLSIIKQTKKLDHPPKVGDLVMLSSADPKKKEPAPAKATKAVKPVAKPPTKQPRSALAAADLDKRALGVAFTASLGRPLSIRLGHYRRFLENYPTSAYATAVAREVGWLESIMRKLEKGAGGPCVAEPEDGVGGAAVLHSPITTLEVGDAAQVVVAIVSKQPAHGARLFLRKVGDEGFDEMALEPTGAYYFRGVIPEQYVSERGRFEYFIEVAFVEGESVPKVASGANPHVVNVTTPVVDKIEREDRSVARVMFEYVNFDMDDGVDDEYWAFEADYFYRISTFLYGVRVGMGIFTGTGGDLKEIEESKDNNREAAVNYGYIEGEFEIVPIFHFMLRLAAGNHRASGDDNAVMNSVYGFEGGVRIGEERKTNLVASGAVLQRIGYEARLALAINVFKRVPISLEGLVTNYPVNDSSPGLRIVLGTGYRFTDWLAILARGSWNARTIKHTGFGGGASLALSW